MNKYNMAITSKQLIFIIIGTQIATGILSLSRVATENAWQDGWITILLGAMVPLLSLIIIERLGRMFPDKNIGDIMRSLFGRIAGPLILFPFIVYIVYFQSIVTRLFAEVTKLYLLPFTPIPAILLVIVLSVIYIVSRGIKTVARINEFLFYLSLLAFTLVLTTILGGIDFTNILPLFETDIKDIARGALTTSYSFAGIEILLVLYFMVTRKDEVLKAGLTAIGITTSIYLIIVVVCILVFGVDALQKILFPLIVLLKSVQVPVIERLEFFFLVIWLTLGPRPVINMTFAASYALGSMLNIDLRRYFTLIVIVIAIAIFVLALVPRDIFVVFTWSDYAGSLSIIFAIIYPLILLAAALLRGKQVKHQE
ncbi:MAG: endospore germination permease [Bacillota bacterium]|nr:endospore germination permease [Bacillota bacterium]